MKLALTERFQRDVKDLAPERKSAVFDAILSLPGVMAQPHLHSGLGVRKLHRSGIWEARVGLGLRLVFTLESELLTLVRVGSHEDIKRYLSELRALRTEASARTFALRRRSLIGLPVQ